jgi:hypothetical protein
VKVIRQLNVIRFPAHGSSFFQHIRGTVSEELLMSGFYDIVEKPKNTDTYVKNHGKMWIMSGWNLYLPKKSHSQDETLRGEYTWSAISFFQFSLVPYLFIIRWIELYIDLSRIGGRQSPSFAIYPEAICAGDDSRSRPIRDGDNYLNVKHTRIQCDRSDKLIFALPFLKRLNKFFKIFLRIDNVLWSTFIMMQSHFIPFLLCI